MIVYFNQMPYEELFAVQIEAEEKGKDEKMIDENTT